jgi:hypothetical protein
MHLILLASHRVFDRSPRLLFSNLAWNTSHHVGSPRLHIFIAKEGYDGSKDGTTKTRDLR